MPPPMGSSVQDVIDFERNEYGTDFEWIADDLDLDQINARLIMWVSSTYEYARRFVEWPEQPEVEDEEVEEFDATGCPIVATDEEDGYLILLIDHR